MSIPLPLRNDNIITPFKNRTIDMSKPVRVYRNLNAKKSAGVVWSILQNGLVVAHSNSVLLVDARAVVRPAGQKRLKETGKKNVHAFIEGKVCNLSAGGRGAMGSSGDDPDRPLTEMRVRYGPDGFMTGPTPVKKFTGADAVHLGYVVSYAYGN